MPVLDKMSVAFRGLGFSGDHSLVSVFQALIYLNLFVRSCRLRPRACSGPHLILV